MNSNDNTKQDVNKEQVQQEPNAKQKLKGLLKELLFYAVLFLLCLYVIPRYVMERTLVEGDSMEPSLYDEEHVMVEKLTYRFDKLKRFDVIVFRPDGKSKDYIKRIIGLPGETVQIIGTDIYIDGVILEEDYGKDPIVRAGRAVVPITLGEGEYFVLGDNRTISDDSRYEIVENVRKDQIVGKALFRCYPLSKFGGFDTK